MTEIIAAVIGGAVGAIVGSILTWIISSRLLKQQEVADFAAEIAELQGAILSATTVDIIRDQNDVKALRFEWGRKNRKWSTLGHHQLAEEIAGHMTTYLDALEAFVQGEIDRDELESRRCQSKDAIADIVARLTVR